MEKERYSLVDVFENNIWTASCPVDIRQGALIYDTLVGQHCLQLQMVNLGQKPLISVYVDVYCYDEGGNLLLGEPINIIYRDLNTPKDGVFGDTETFYLRSGRVKSVSCHVVRVMYLSGEIWKPAGRPVRVNAQSFDQLEPDLKQLFFQRLRDSYFSGVETEFKVIARQDHDFWVCTCGKANDNDQEQCQRCGMNRAWILQNLNVEALCALRDAKAEAQAAQQAPEQEQAAQPAGEGEPDRTVQLDEPDPRLTPMDGATGRYVPLREKSAQQAANAVPPVYETAAPEETYDPYDPYEDELEDPDEGERVSLAIKIALGVASVLLVATIAGILWYFLR